MENQQPQEMLTTAYFPGKNITRPPLQNEEKLGVPLSSSHDDNAAANGVSESIPSMQARLGQATHASPVKRPYKNIESKYSDEREKLLSQDSSVYRPNTNPPAATTTSETNVKVILPRIARVVNKLLEDCGIQRYDERVVHLLVDILQRETLKILASASDLANFRIAENQESYPNERAIIVTADDVRLAIQEYLQKNVISCPYNMMDSQRLTTSTNSLLLGASSTLEEASAIDFGPPVSDLGHFPSTLPPHLPEDVNINTMIPNWDLEVREKEEVEDSDADASSLNL